MEELAQMQLTTFDGTPIVLPSGQPLRVGHVLAEAVLTRKTAAALEQLEAYTLAQQLFHMANGGPWSPSLLCGLDMRTFLDKLRSDVGAYGATQPNLLVVGQVLQALNHRAE